jgi:hypothetical protein
MELNGLREFAVELARGAGEITLKYFRRPARDEYESRRQLRYDRRP